MNDSELPIRLVKCLKCPSEMGIFEACLGSSTPENRGKIMQRCQNRTCNYTVFHSAAYPTHEVALQIANYYNETIPTPNAMKNTLFYPPALFPSADHTTTSTLRCMGATCRREQKLNRVAQKCSFQRCSSCCDEEFLIARRDNKFRKECAFHHKQPIQSTGPINIPIPNLSVPSLSFNTQSLPASTVDMTSAITSQQLSITATPSQTSAMAPQPLSITAAPSQTLATSIGPLWASVVTSARARSHIKQQISQVKAEKHVLIVIWSKPELPPIRFKHTITQSYPNFSLGTATRLLEHLKINIDDLIETWIPETNEWILHELHAMRQVVDGQRVLYRVTPITSPPFIENWENLDDEMELQKKLNKNIHSLISPIKANSSPSSSFSISQPLGSKHKQKSQSAVRKTKKICIRPFPIQDDSRGTGSKRWPADFHVCELKDGFEFVTRGQKQNIPLSELLNNFFGQQIPRSTFYRIKNMFDDFDEVLKARFIEYGRMSKGLWSNLIKNSISKCDQDSTTDGDTSDSIVDLPDPKTLILERFCPLCNAQLMELPPHLEDHFQRLKVSPKHNNYFQLLRDFCAGHVLQTRADKQMQCHPNWKVPKDIDYALLPTRVESFKTQLNRQLSHPIDNPLFQRVKYQFRQSGNSTTSFSGLMERMKFEHCGYYGDKSGLIIHKTLLKLFPTPENTNPLLHEQIKPFNYHQFLTAILVPYTAILLIQADSDDPRFSFDDAYTTWQDSGECDSFYTYATESDIKTEDQEFTMTQSTIQSTDADIIIISDDD